MVSSSTRVYAPRAASTALGAGPRVAVRAPSRRARDTRSRRVEWTLAGIGALALTLGACALRPRLTPADAPRVALQAAGGPAVTLPVAPRAQAVPVAATVAGPPLAFSFAKFEADPALVLGAASAGVPSLSGESAIVVDLDRREVIYAKNPHKRQLMASTAKLMTALVAVEHAPLDKIVAVPLEATLVEPNHMGLKAGEKLTVRELLYGMLLDSGNDAAETIAAGVGGTGGRTQFIAWMNEKTQQLALQNTHFANPAGLDDELAYSTAYDLAVLGAHALKHPELREIVGTKSIVIPPSKEPGHEHGWFGPGNLNSLLSTYRGAIGLKPGYTEDAGYTLVAAAERDGRTLIAVTLNSRLHFSDATRLLDFGFSRKPE